MFYRLATGVLGLALFLSPAALLAQDDCTADIRGTLKRKESGNNSTKYIVQLDVSAQMRCAVVSFVVVVIEEENDTGEKHEIRVARRVKIRDSVTTTQKFNYKLKKGRAVVDHRFEQTSCEACD